MQTPLTKLDDTITKLSKRSFFNSPASTSQILTFKNLFDTNLPRELEDFLLRYNGGFIADSYFSEGELNDQNQLDFVRWKSNHFLTIDKIVEALDYVDAYTEIVDASGLPLSAVERYIPLLQTKYQELFVLRLSKKQATRPILELARETSPDYWIYRYDSLYSLIDNYAECQGNIPL